jgi:hypothetical protein
MFASFSMARATGQMSDKCQVLNFYALYSLKDCGGSDGNHCSTNNVY